MSSERPPKAWYNPRTLLRTMLMLEDTHHSIALGAAIGIFVGLTPTVGIQMVIVVLLSLLIGRFVRFNRLAALITVYISNPLTTVPIYWIDYKVGTIFVDGELTREQLSGILKYNGFAEWWNTVVSLFVDIGTPLVLGSLVVATIGGAITYPLMLQLLKSMPKPKRKKRKKPEKAVSTTSSP